MYPHLKNNMRTRSFVKQVHFLSFSKVHVSQGSVYELLSTGFFGKAASSAGSLTLQIELALKSTWKQAVSFARCQRPNQLATDSTDLACVI